MMSKQNFEKIFIEKANYLLQKRERMPFIIDSDNESAVNFFLSYFSNIDALTKLGGKSHKGIFLYGNYGTGKSLFFEVLEEVYKQYQYPHIRIKTVNTIELSDQLISELARPNQLAANDKSIYQRQVRGTIHFEDLGAERKLNHFGNSIEFMSEILQLRYAKSRRNACKTFATSNLSPQEINNRYGLRLYDRMFEMFNFIQLTGESRRK